MNFVSRMTAGRGTVNRSERTTRSWSASTISALPSIRSRSARRIGTIVSGSYDALSARQPTITYSSTGSSCTNSRLDNGAGARDQDAALPERVRVHVSVGVTLPSYGGVTGETSRRIGRIDVV